MRSAEEFYMVQQLITAGFNDCAIARRTGIPRPTVRDWRSQPPKRLEKPALSPCGVDHDFGALPISSYCYLLGLYLGDGDISRNKRVWRLRITLDTKYPAIIDRCRQAVEIVMPGQRAGLVAKKGCVQVSLYSKHWPCLFPQHGPGRKHNRRIALEPWQQDLVDRATEEFVRGLIHSDGCRVVANDRGVKSIRYHFTNHSEDILNLFTAALDRLGISWTRSTKYVVSIYRKAATARLDEFIGPKV
ncbi:LAGLIDADG family homing endonuclease [Mycolicibacterium septicum]|uniref:LAGLIDADG family homing endonuclease n=1 Tax=Mycolicibacterium septicum TaxID=98668 RepID=UPI0023E2E4C5|nr:LAGLIDADG family homing endonuclease [Mycolicibacterium septicum]MDF3339684.1 LAGLIDADG family homing endonuclease [Mycolicibacterium septicum]